VSEGRLIDIALSGQERCVMFVQDCRDIGTRRGLMFLTRSGKRKAASEGKPEQSQESFNRHGSCFSPCAKVRDTRKH